MTAAFQYGGLVHPNWEMNLAQFSMRSRLSPRGRKISSVYTMRLEGEIQSETGPAGITTRLNQIIAAYFTQNQDAKFYVDGQLTPHQLPNASSISGVKVLEFAHLRGDAAEYANKRTLAVVIQAEYDEPESQLFQWDETIEWVGTTGPRDEWFQGFDRPRKQRICKKTVQHIVQTGMAIGWAAYVEPPGPILPLSEVVELRSVKRGHPRFFGQAHRLFPIRWTHRFVTDVFTEPVPNIR